MIVYDDNFVESLPKDFDLAILAVLKRHREYIKSDTDINSLTETRYLLETLAAAYDRKIGMLSFKTPKLLIGALVSLEEEARKHLVEREIHARREEVESSKERFSALLNVGFVYEFSDADLSRIQTLVNELRQIVSASADFSDDHKRRILARLEKLQGELHKKMSNLDNIYGFIGDAGVALGKFGKESKPFIDRIGEIVEIAWRSQATAEQLPASARPALLTPPDGKEN